MSNESSCIILAAHNIYVVMLRSLPYIYIYYCSRYPEGREKNIQPVYNIGCCSQPEMLYVYNIYITRDVIIVGIKSCII